MGTLEVLHRSEPVGSHSCSTGRAVVGWGKKGRPCPLPRIQTFSPGGVQAAAVAAAQTELAMGSLEPLPGLGDRGCCLQGASRGSHLEAGSGPRRRFGRSRLLQGPQPQTAPGCLAWPCPPGPRSPLGCGTGGEVLRSPAESGPGSVGSGTLPPKALHLPWGRLTRLTSKSRQDAGTWYQYIPHTCPPAPPYTGHRASRGAKHSHRDSDRDGASR